MADSSTEKLIPFPFFSLFISVYLLKALHPWCLGADISFEPVVFMKSCQNLNSFTYSESILCPLLAHGKVSSH